MPSLLSHSTSTGIGIASLILTSAAIYLTGLRLKDRPTAIISGLLVATSLALAAGAAWAPQSLLLAALISFALFAFSMDRMSTALWLGGLAAFVRADGLLFGAVLLVVALWQQRNAWVGMAAFLVLAAVSSGLWLTLWHADIGFWMPLHSAEPRDTLLMLAAFVPSAWFLLPFLAEWGTAQDRAKWWGAAVWVLICVICLALKHALGAVAGYIPFFPVVYLMVGTGIARLLPAFAGEMPTPLSRYSVAFAAVAVVLGATAFLEWSALRSISQQGFRTSLFLGRPEATENPIGWFSTGRESGKIIGMCSLRQGDIL